MRRRKHLAWKVGSLILVTAILALSVAGIAAAQSSASFQLGCWGVVTGGGDLHTMSPSNFTLIDSVGQFAAGQSGSASYTIRAGYLQPFDFDVDAAGTSSPTQVGQTEPIYLPWVSNFVRIVYTCPY